MLYSSLMWKVLFATAAASLLVPFASAQDTGCPAYPASASVTSQRALLRTARPLIKPKGFRPVAYDPKLDTNFVDSEIFRQMAADGIEPASPATDAEFIRRVTLDITGRIPSAEDVVSYTSGTNGNKKAALISRLIGSREYVDRWTLWYMDKFQITSDYYNFIGVPGRNLLYNYIRNFIGSGGSYRDFATSLIKASGESHRSGAPNYLLRGIQYSQPIQDTWDEMTNRVTVHFLGVQTQCISCHNGRGHLEPINLFLSKKTRLDFWRQSAFFSRMNILFRPDDTTGSSLSGLITDRSAGGYNSVLADPNNPGPRPARTGGPYTPAYIFNGQAPPGADWRNNLASFVVNDRQFARAFVNYVWAHFFRTGIVDPPDAFDMARIDAAHPPTDPWPNDPSRPWPLQPSHPALLEKLTDAFIASDYRLAPLMKLMAESRAYGLSGQYEGTWTPTHALDYAKSLPRRLTAEELYDALITATGTQVPMRLLGFDRTLYYAGELPDPTEPNLDGAHGVDAYGYIRDFLTALGRGDWWRSDRDNDLDPSRLLFFMNSPTVVERTFGNTAQLANSLVARLAATPNLSNEQALAAISLATLGRPPTDAEKAKVLAYPAPDPSREQWLGDIQWVLLNEAEFFFNH